MKKPPRITNTKEAPPLEHLAAAAVMGTSGAIEHMEKRGQRELESGAQLPRTGLLIGFDGIYDRTPKFDPATDTPTLKAWWSAMGIKLLALGDDPQFADVELPAGWKIAGTDHAMWSDLIDEKGRKRAAIFYKAAFYDRHAHINAETRYSQSSDYIGRESRRSVVRDHAQGGAIIYATKPTPQACPVDDRAASAKWLREMEDADNEAKGFLLLTFPQYQNPLAYWDDPPLPIVP